MNAPQNSESARVGLDHKVAAKNHEAMQPEVGQDIRLLTPQELKDLASSIPSFSDLDEKSLVRRIDRRVLPILFLIYVAAFLDRVNISNALTMGLPQDLGLSKHQPNIALAIFFIPYILFEVPSNIAMKELRPHVWLSTCTVAFGITMLAQGFVESFSGLVATRFFLGLAEAGIFPGSFYLISFWYKREESQKRFTVFWCSIIVAGSFGGLLASAIANMDGIGGLENWRWIFILEGIATILAGIVSYFSITDFPEHANWLTDEERKFVKLRTRHSENANRQVIGLREISRFFTDPARVLGGLMYWGIVVPVYAYSYFAPTIIKTLGFSVVQTQLWSVIPFAGALVSCVAVSYVSDWARIRLPFVAFGLSLAIAGLVLLMTVHDHFATRFGALCLVAAGALTAGICIACWYVMNLHGHIERSIGTAWMTSFGNSGGIVATFTFISSDAPRYTKGYSICLGAIAVAVVSTAAYTVFIARARRRIDPRTGLTYSF